MKEIPIEILERLEFKKPHGNRESDEDTHFPPITKIHHETRKCEDCALMVSDRRIDLKLNIKPFPHWKTTCRNCGMIKHPITNDFTLDQNEYRVIINDKTFIRTK